MPYPTFLIIGAAKAGTTSLYHYLHQHPDIFMSPVKEPNFFVFECHTLHFEGPGDQAVVAQSVTTLAAYEALFAEGAQAQARGEASPLYLHVPEAPARIQRHVPDIKLIACLRHPVDRLHSHFWNMVKCGREPLQDFAEALAAEPERQRANWEWGWQYTAGGFYHAQLSRYYATFDPSQILVLLFEDFIANPVAVLQSIFRFLDVDDAFIPNVLLQHNATGLPKNPLLHRLMTSENPLRSTARMTLPLPVKKFIATWLWSRNVEKPTLDPALRADLLALYHDDILKLQTLLQRDLSHWLQP